MHDELSSRSGVLAVDLFSEEEAPPAVIAEIGANHNGCPDLAHRMVDAVADAGAQYVKFQLYQSDELIADPDAPVTWGAPNCQRSETMGSMFSRLSLQVDEVKELFEHSRQRGMVPFASPFSEQGVDRLMDMGAEILKIAASDVTHLPLLRYAAQTGLPIILSLGKCTLGEADEAVRTLEASGVSRLALLHCVASYPSPMQDLNLRVIPMLKTAFPGRTIGFSDHSIGLVAPIAAVSLGARIIEKHVTLDRNNEGPDHWFSIDIEELGELISSVGNAYTALGTSRKYITPAETLGRSRGVRSLTAARDLRAGTVIAASDIRIVRPGSGLSPAFHDVIVGMQTKVDVAATEPFLWQHFKDLQF